MKEIKFKAWDKTSKRWHYFNLRNIQIYLKEFNDHLINGDEFYLFTGLHDKNGKEIWEGDIVKNQWRNNPYKVSLFSGAFREHWDYLAPYCEVIGNIYENPELLERQK